MADRLRVGMLAPIAWRVPPRHYGPWERIVSILTEGLVARGVGVSGLLVAADDLAGGVAAVHQVSGLDRRATRAHAERRFSAERMVDDYLDLYHQILALAHGTLELAVGTAHPSASN